MEYPLKFHKLYQIEGRRYVIIVGIVAVTYLILQYFMLPYGNALKALVSDRKVIVSVNSGYSSGQLSVRSETKGRNDHISNVGIVKQGDRSENFDGFIETDTGLNEVDSRIIQEVVSEANGVDEVGGVEKLPGLKVEDAVQDNRSKDELESPGKNEEIVGPEHQISVDRILDSNESASLTNNENVERWDEDNLVEIDYFEDWDQARNDSRVRGSRRKKKVRPGMPPITVVPFDRMNRILAKHLASSSKMKPQWPSLRDRDREILEAKFQIINSAVSHVDKEIYAPVFRNVSIFMRSYELMEKTLKVYVYRDGEKPIFHQPTLKGIYASEGWFMKLMEGSKRFSVKNPEKAHLFYMPFSSRMLEHALYVPSSHNRTKLRQFVKGYTEAIAAKYPFWNRTGGADHFIVACHDWALYETRHHMENSIKALCNADVTIGFKIGRDVSLPETFVRYARNPLRDLGGKPPSERNILAFYAGNSHGYLRPILLKHWKDKDPDMRIYGLMPTRVSRRMSYMQHMKSSKYCICPKGHEVNSPRVIEAIFYECVPVIISDNFVPPFFEILNWEAFSLILAEKDIPNLKEILVSIPEAKYIEMQLAVRKVQQHFLWHARPKKYDLFHMTLHSIWYSRVFQIRH